MILFTRITHIEISNTRYTYSKEYGRLDIIHEGSGNSCFMENYYVPIGNQLALTEKQRTEEVKTRGHFFMFFFIYIDRWTL